jgi:hypothetical protein
MIDKQKLQVSSSRQKELTELESGDYIKEKIRKYLDGVIISFWHGKTIVRKLKEVNHDD